MPLPSAHVSSTTECQLNYATLKVSQFAAHAKFGPLGKF